MARWDAFAADWYLRTHPDHATNHLAVDRVDLAADAVVVDLGCGLGTALRHAAERVTAGSLIGVDLVPRMVEHAMRLTSEHPAAARIEFRVGEATALPVADDLADVVLAFDTFHHWAEPEAGLAEVRRVLKSGGTFLVAQDDREVDAYGFVAMAEAAGFEVLTEEQVREEGVRFTLWHCA